MNMRRSPRIPSGVNRHELCNAVGVGHLRAAQECLPGRIEPAKLPREARIHTGRVAVPHIDREILERRALRALHLQHEAQSHPALAFGNVTPKRIQIEVERPRGLPRVQGASVRAARSPGASSPTGAAGATVLGIPAARAARTGPRQRGGCEASQYIAVEVSPSQGHSGESTRTAV